MYTGNVVPGGPTDERELPQIVIRKCSVGEFDNNAYLLTCRRTGAQLLIDAAADAARLKDLVAEGTGSLELIVTTHRHPDHIRALAELASWSGAPTAAGAEDADALPIPPDRSLHHGDAIILGDLTFDIVALRGHTPGGIALAYGDPGGSTHLFTGDSLFPGGIGNTKNPGQDFDALFHDVTTRVFDVYDDDTWFYPGHGADSTIGAERPHLEEWRRRRW